MAYKELFERVQNIAYLGSTGMLLGWDQEVMMPKQGIALRAHQMSMLSSITHEKFVQPSIGRLIRQAKKEKLSKNQHINLKRLEKDYRKARKIPEKHIALASKIKTRATEAWREARKTSNFRLFQPHLEKIIRIEKKTAHYLNPRKNPYDVLLEEYDESLTTKKLNRHFAKIKKAVLAIMAHPKPRPLIKPPFSIALQEKVCRDVATAMGFDWQRGRMDVSTHPFTVGSPVDTRITTRYNTREPFESMLATVHEVGHALYEQGVPWKHYGTALGETAGLSVHESQSRIWENHLGRSLAFWQWLHPKIKAWKLSPRQCYDYVNRVEPSLIRVEADEVSYHLHVILRYEIEQGLFDGSIKAKNIPKEWNWRMKEYLGITPRNDATGCLQDIHWTMGFAYFPTYSIGTMIAAQLFAKAPVTDEQFRKGNFLPLKSWLGKHIHQHGSKYTPDELIQKATGEKPNPEALIAHLKSKHKSTA